MSIRQSISFDASAESIYNALLSPEKFAELTGAPAEISENEEGEFSCFSGQITGRHVQLVPNRKIIQAWRVSSWEEGVHSTVTFTLEQSENSTTLHLKQSGYPTEAHDHLESGWHKMYWKPLVAYLSVPR